MPADSERPTPARDPDSHDDRTRPAPARAESADDGVACDLCGNTMIERHCKLVCPVCGFMRDCSDP